jgi:ATP/maltotriose-dependent transcriptional regulator MalT
MAKSRSRVKSGARREKPLSCREKEIVQLVAQACRNKEVAQKLSISEQTVKNHLYKIFGKLGICNRRKLWDLSRGLT